MRKSWSAFAMLMAAVAVSTSTVWAAEKPTFGVVGGLHLTNLAIDPDPTDVSLDSLTRANIGGFAEFALGQNMRRARRSDDLPFATFGTRGDLTFLNDDFVDGRLIVQPFVEGVIDDLLLATARAAPGLLSDGDDHITPWQ